MKPLSFKTNELKQSDIRAVTALINKHKGINLGQGICDLPTPDAVKKGAIKAIEENKSIYSPYSGVAQLKEVVLNKYQTFNKIPIESEQEVMISVGSSGAFVSAALALFEPGDEVILFEPFYGYHLGLLKLVGVEPKFCLTKAPKWEIDFNQLESLITAKTKAIILTTPGNPNGKVWIESELMQLLELLEKYDLYALVDEVYEYMTYDSFSHQSLASIPGALKRTITISSYSKTFNMTGWRLGSACGPAEIIEKMALISDLVYICAPTPLQHGLIEGLKMEATYFSELKSEYTKKRALFCSTLSEIGFTVYPPEGAYYAFVNFEQLSKTRSGFANDKEACKTLIEQAGVASVPGSSFFSNPEDGKYYLRFCYAKEWDILKLACKQLSDWSKRSS